MRIACIADTHVPDRARSIDKRAIELLKKSDIDIILHAGDLTSLEVLDVLEEIAPTVAVQGNMDYFYGTELPRERIVNVGRYRILVFHGSGIYPRGDTQQLRYKAMERECNVIVTGHTHKPFFGEIGGVTIINPGSLGDPRYGSRRSFMIVDIDDKIKYKLVEL